MISVNAGFDCMFYQITVESRHYGCQRTKIFYQLSGKKSKSVFDFLTYPREMGFSFSYEEVVNLIRLIGASNEIYRVSKFDYSLSFGTKQNSLRQIFFALWFFKDLFTKNKNWFFFNFSLFACLNKYENIYSKFYTK